MKQLTRVSSSAVKVVFFVVFILCAIIAVAIVVMSIKSPWSSKPQIKEIANFERPFCVAQDSQERILVCDFNVNQIKIFDQALKPVSVIGQTGTKQGEFNKPHSIDFNSKSEIIVSDYANKRVQRFSRDFDFKSYLASDKKLLGPATAYFGGDGNLYVSDYDSSSLLKFDKNGKYLGWIGAKEDGSLTDGWNLSGNSTNSTSPGGFDRLHGAKVDSNGMIYVVDSWNHRVQRFDEDGKFRGFIGSRADGTLTDGWELEGQVTASQLPGGFNVPIAIEISGDDLFVLEFKNARIQRFSKSGEFLGWYGGMKDGGLTPGFVKSGLSMEGNEPGAFKEAYDLKIYENKIFVADTGNKRVQILTFDK